MIKAQREISRKFHILTYAKGTNNISEAFRYFKISWKIFFGREMTYAVYVERTNQQ